MVNLKDLNPFAYTVQATTEISQLRIYPIKSCRGIPVKSARLTRVGLDLDRHWMFMHKQFKKFHTIRQEPRLTLIDTALESSAAPSVNGSEDDLELVISVRDQPDKRVQIPARPSRDWLEANCTLMSDVEIWNDITDGWVYPDSINKIFSDFLGAPLVLVYKGPTPRLLSSGSAAPSRLGRQEAINFSDQLPILLSNEKSMIDVNAKLAAAGVEQMTIERFRPNIVIAGDEGPCKAWAEDKWLLARIVNGPSPTNQWVSLGPSTIDIDVVCRCGRCTIPNTNPETGISSNTQPWDTLFRPRKIDDGHKLTYCFGMLCCPRSEGVVEVGMKLEVLAVTNEHYYIKKDKNPEVERRKKEREPIERDERMAKRNREAQENARLGETKSDPVPTQTENTTAEKGSSTD
ncbi:MAG: hypothetical protein Q9159_002222 [Coniocarpon cinnabarinum]